MNVQNDSFFFQMQYAIEDFFIIPPCQNKFSCKILYKSSYIYVYLYTTRLDNVPQYSINANSFLLKQERVCSFKDRLVVDLLLIKCCKFWFWMTLNPSNYQIGCLVLNNIGRILVIFWNLGLLGKMKKLEHLLGCTHVST